MIKTDSHTRQTVRYLYAGFLVKPMTEAYKDLADLVAVLMQHPNLRKSLSEEMIEKTTEAIVNYQEYYMHASRINEVAQRIAKDNLTAPKRVENIMAELKREATRYASKIPAIHYTLLKARGMLIAGSDLENTVISRDIMKFVRLGVSKFTAEELKKEHEKNKHWESRKDVR